MIRRIRNALRARRLRKDLERFFAGRLVSLWICDDVLMHWELRVLRRLASKHQPTPAHQTAPRRCASDEPC